MPQKKARKHLRAVRKGYLDMAAEKEGGGSYRSGGFQNNSVNISSY